MEALALRKIDVVSVSSNTASIPRSALAQAGATPGRGRTDTDILSAFDTGRIGASENSLLEDSINLAASTGESDVPVTQIAIQLRDAEPESSHIDITVNGVPLVGVMFDEASQTLSGVVPVSVKEPYRIEFVQPNGNKTVFAPETQQQGGKYMTAAHGDFASQLLNFINEHDSSADSLTLDTAGGAQSVFGRLLPKESNQPDEAKLQALAGAMDEAGDMSNPDTGMPVGFVFMGQFIDHDLTLDARTTLGTRPADDTAVINFRTPRLELDSVYLNGQGVSSFLYDGTHRLIVGTESNPDDLPRTKADVAIIGDPRNDENLFVSQVHGLFLRLHNRYMDELSGDGETTMEHFQEARHRCRHLYQRIIIDDYLPRIVHESTLSPLIEGFWNGALPGPVDWAGAPDMPFEFSAAAFRFGHSQVRDSYRLNDAKSAALFDTGGFRPVPSTSNLDWRFFFDLGDGEVQYARPIDTKLSRVLLNLPHRVAEGGPVSLPERNLIRGQLTFELPYGEDIAEDWGYDVIDRHPLVTEAGLEKTPLWFYVLAEAEAHEGKLGPVGGTIVAGTLLNIMLRDPSSVAGTGPAASADAAQSTMSSVVSAVA